MGKRTSGAVITSDKYISESGTQGGKALGDNIVLFSFIIGIPLLVIGLYALFSILLGFYPSNTAIIILVILVNVIGLLMTIGGYSIYRTKHFKK